MGPALSSCPKCAWMFCGYRLAIKPRAVLVHWTQLFMSSCSRLPAGPKVWIRWSRIASLTSEGASLSTTQYDHISVFSGPLGCHTPIMCRVKLDDIFENTLF